MIVVSAGVVAGVASWVAGELAHGLFRPRLSNVVIMGMTLKRPSPESQQAADLANATLGSAILGAATALALGLAGGLVGRDPWRGAWVGLGAFPVGALAGAATSQALVPVFFRQNVPDWNDLLTPILVRGGIWSMIGIVGGVAFAAGLRSWRLAPVAALSAVVSAFAASALFHLLSGFLFPHSNPWDPVGGSAVLRLLATSLMTLLVAVGVTRGTPLGARPPAEPGPAR
jgi:hypothetical protein